MKKKLIAMLTVASMLLTLMPSLVFADNAIQPGDIVRADQLHAGDRIVAGLGQYQYGECDCYFDYNTQTIVCNTHANYPTGCQEATPISWIILDPEHTNMGTEGMYLISKNVLDEEVFNAENQAYQGSPVQQWCIGFYNNLLASVDTEIGDAILSTNKSDPAYNSLEWDESFALVENILNGDKVFLPSAQEVDKDYIWVGGDSNDERAAAGANPYAWLRSPRSDDIWDAGYINKYGEVATEGRDLSMGVRPALNLNTESLLFEARGNDEYALLAGVKVEFDTQGGSDIESQLIPKGEKATEPETPTKAGCTFKGWYDAAEGGTKVDLATQTFEEDTVLYAQWEETSTTI